MENTAYPRRQREDGSWTYTTPEWDAAHRFAVGTRVAVQVNRQGATETGTVFKDNSTTAWVRFDGGRPDCKVAHWALTRLEESR